MLIQLIKLTLKGNFTRVNKKDPTKAKSTLPMMILIFGFVGVSYYATYKLTAEYFVQAGAYLEYFESIGTQLLIFLMLTDISIVSATLLDSKYNDVLLTLPLKPLHITLSRLLTALIYGYAMVIAFGIPGLVAWFTEAGFSMGILLRGLLIMIFWRFIPLAIGVVVGYIFNKLTYRSKYKDLLKSAFSLAFIAVYYYFIFTNDTPDPNSGITKLLSKVQLLNWFAKAIYSGDIVSILLIVGIGSLLLAAVVVVLNKVLYKSIISVKSVNKVTRKNASFKKRPVVLSLIKREQKHIINSYIYLTNNAIALLFLVAGTVFLLIKKEEIEMYIGYGLGQEFAVALVVAAACALLTTYMVSYCSISIEGKKLATIKSLPIEPQTVLESKILFHYMYPGVIVLVGTVVLGIVFKIRPLLFVPLVLIPQLFLIVTDMLGLYLNLLMPKMDWASEEQVVKRGGSTILGMLSSMALVALIIGAYALILYEHLFVDTYMLIVAGVLLVAAIGLYFLLMNDGVKKFKKI